MSDFMTNNEAIYILGLVVETAKGRCFVTDEVISDAYNMAINALKAQEKAQEVSNNSPELDNNFGDLISRKAAIDAFAEHKRHETSNGRNYTLFGEVVSECAVIIRNLPSAQLMPEPDKEKISELLKCLYLSRIVHLSKEAIVSRQHYCEELWKAMFHDDEFPLWMHWS